MCARKCVVPRILLCRQACTPRPIHPKPARWSLAPAPLRAFIPVEARCRYGVKGGVPSRTRQYERRCRWTEREQRKIAWHSFRPHRKGGRERVHSEGLPRSVCEQRDRRLAPQRGRRCLLATRKKCKKVEHFRGVTKLDRKGSLIRCWELYVVLSYMISQTSSLEYAYLSRGVDYFPSSTDDSMMTVC